MKIPSPKIIGYLPCCQGWAHLAVYEDSPERDKNDPELIPVDEYERGVEEGRF